MLHVIAYRILVTSQDKYKLHDPVSVPSNTTKLNYGSVNMTYVSVVRV